MHIALAGDSVFDNGVYVEGGPDLAAVLREALGPGGEVSLLAVDGSVSPMVAEQLRKLPRGVDRLFVSSGGNDALACRFVIDAPAGSASPPDGDDDDEPAEPELLEELPLASPRAAALRGLLGFSRSRKGFRARLAAISRYPDLLDRLAAVQEEFRGVYRPLVAAALRTGLPVAVCTIYTAVPGLPPRQRAAIAAFNDVILGEASIHGLQVIDTRSFCVEPKDFSAVSPIEPSVAGSRKIAQRIIRAARDPAGNGEPCRVYA